VVAEDGREYYAVSNEFDTRAVAANDWLMHNVMKSIDHETFVVTDGEGMPFVRQLFLTDPAAKPRKEIAEDIVNFIGDDSHADLLAWYCAYDHVCLCQLFGKMIDLPDNIPMQTDDIKTLLKRAERKVGHRIQLPRQPAGNHNALEDARWNIVRYNYIMEVLGE
jgi:hypothetical protein